jgi:hypothetical protein
VGIATQDPELRKRFTGAPEFVTTFFRFIAEEVRELMAELGFRTMEEMIGRVDRLDVRAAVDHWKARGLDFTQILYRPPMAPEVPIRCVRPQDHGLERSLDMTTIVPLTGRPRPAPVDVRLPIGTSTGRWAILGYGDLATERTGFPTTPSGSASPARP